MIFKITSKPIRTVLRWQIYITALLTLIGALWAGIHGAISALLGGMVSIAAASLFGLIISRAKTGTVGETLRLGLRAEAAKIIVIVFLLGWILMAYKSVIVGGLIASFIITILVFQLAFFVREK